MKRALTYIGVAIASTGIGVAAELTNLTYRVVGARLDVTPTSLFVPKGIAGSILPSLNIPELAVGTHVEAVLRGPSFAARTVLGLPNQALPLPPLFLSGDYQLDNIRLVNSASSETVLEGTPSRVPIRVFDEVLISRVTSRPLTLDEIREKGIVIDESNFSALEFEVSFVVDGQTIPIFFPVISPVFRDVTELIPAAEIAERLAIAALLNQELMKTVELPDELQSAALNFDIQPINFQVVADEGNKGLGLRIPPIPALLVIPGNVGFLNQFFSVQLFTANGSPSGSGLNVLNLQAKMTLPAGADQIPGTYPIPGDDPLRFARVGTNAVIQDVLPVVNPGLDGKSGTPDDIARLNPGDEGRAEFLVEGLREGLHILNVDLTADLEGLAGGVVKIKGAAAGAVLVRNPNFSLAFTHPRTIRAFEPYEASVTILNTGGTVANLLNVTLNAASISGAQLLSDATVELGNLAPGESATATYRLLAQRTGSITFSQLTGDDGLTGRFRLKMGVDERGVALSPDALALPEYVNYLPTNIVRAAQRVLGQALGVATAGQRPAGVLPVARGIIAQRAIELAEAGQRVLYGDPLDRVLADLLLDWQGGRGEDAGFLQIMSTTNAGREFREALMAAFDQAAGDDATDRLGDRAIDLAGRGEAWWLAAVDHPLLQPSTNDSDVLNYIGSNGAWSVTRPASNTLFNWRITNGLPAGEHVAALLLDTNGAGTLLDWTLPPLAAGTCMSFDPASNDLLFVDNECDGTSDFSIAASSLPVIESPPEVLNVRQDTDVISGRPFPSCYPPEYRNYGQALAVLFSKPMRQEDADRPEAYTLDNGVPAFAVQVQPGGRIALLNVEKPVGVFRPRSLAVDGVTDPRSNALVVATNPVILSASIGVPMNGRVVRADGSPATNVPVTLTMLDQWQGPFNCEAATHRIAQTFTDGDGNFTFDFVMAGVPYSLSATDTEGLTDEAVEFILQAVAGDDQLRTAFEEIAEHSTTSRDALIAAFNTGSLPQALAVAEGLDRAVFRDHIGISSPRIGVEQTVALRFRGRSAVTGVVKDSLGATVRDAAVNLYPDPGSREKGRGVFSGSDGRFAFQGVPLGSFTVEVIDSLGRRRTVSDFIGEPGLTKDIEIVLVDPVPVVLTSLQGRVFETDGVTPHPNARVFVGRAGGGFMDEVVASVDADGSGLWLATGIPVGAWDVVGVSFDGRRRGDRYNISATAGATNTVNVTLQGTTTVKGRVEFANGNPVTNALVSGGEALVHSTTNGEFLLTGVPLGHRSFSAGLQKNLAAGIPFTRIGSASVDIVAGIENFVVIRLGARGSIVGEVRDANGTLVKNERVVIPAPAAGGFFYTDTDTNGNYRFENLALGPHTISSPGPEVSTRTPENILAAGQAAIDAIQEQQSEDEIAAALGELFAIFAGVDDPLVNPSGVAFNPIGWGYTRVALNFDGQVAVGNVQYLGLGTIAGKTINGDGVPIGARVQLTGVGPDAFGDLSFIVRGERNSDPATGVFAFDEQALLGSWGLQAATPLIPVVISTSGFTTPGTPNATNVVLQFPPEEETSGRLKGLVRNPDGSLAGSGIVVRISFGGLEIQTDTNGAFDTQLDIPAGGYSVEAEDLSTGLKGLSYANVQAGITNFAEVILLGKGAIEVHVKQANGLPAPGASVDVRGGRYPYETGAGTTDTNGVIAFLNLFEGPYAVGGSFISGFSTVRGRVSGTITHDQTNVVEMTLGPSGAIKGHFYESDASTPVPFANVAIGDVGFTATDSNGFFMVEGVPVGTYGLLGSDPLNGRAASATATLTADGQTQTVDLVESVLGEINGTVINSYRDGVVAGAIVRLSVQDGITGQRIATTGPDGAFAFPGTPAAPFFLDAEDPNSGLHGNASGELSPAMNVLTIDIPIAALALLDIHVFEPGGITVETNAGVSLNGPTLRQADTDLSGDVSFQDLPLGGYTITAASLNPLTSRSVAQTSVTISAFGQAPDATLTLPGVGTVTGLVFASDGTNPVQGAEVSLSVLNGILGGASLGPSLTDSAGAYRFDNVPLAGFRVSAREGALASSANGVLVTNTQVTNVILVLGPSVSVTGFLVRADGATPVAGAQVSITYSPPSGLLGLAADITEVLGGFSFEEIPVGTATVESIVQAFSGIARTTMVSSVNGELVNLGALRLDEENLRVVGITPPNTAIGISTLTNVLIEFNETIEQFNLGGIFIQTGSTVIATTITRENDSNGMPRFVRLTPTQPLVSETKYDVFAINGDRFDATGGLVARGPVDRVGKPLTNTFSASFTTRDDQPPGLLSFTPTEGQEQVDPSPVVRLSFTEQVQNGVSITVASGLGPVAGSVGLTLNDLVAVFTPNAPLPINQTITVNVNGVQDLAGNALLSQPLVRQFHTLDTLGPDIALLHIKSNAAPLAGETVEMEAVLTVPDTNAAVRISADFVVFGQSQPGDLDLPYTLPATGSIVFRAIAIDRFGNEGPIATTNITVVANQPPVAGILRIAPTNGPVFSGRSMTVDVTAVDDGGLSEVRGNIGGAASVPLQSTTAAVLRLIGQVSSNAGPGSLVSVYGLAVDNASQTSALVSLDIPVADGVAPSVTLVAPTNNQFVIAGQTVSVQVAVADAFGVQAGTVTVSGAVSQQFALPVTPGHTAGVVATSFIVPTNILPAGQTISVQVRAWDAAGYTNSSSVSQLRIFDGGRPAVTIIAPSNGVLFNPNDEVLMQVSATDDVGVVEVQFTLDGAFITNGTTGVISPVMSTNVDFLFRIASAVTQQHAVLRAIARDGLGQSVTSAAVGIEVTLSDITPPETFVTAASAPGAGTSNTISFAVTDGYDDLAHVQIYFRRNGIGTFNLFTETSGTNILGRYFPQSGTNGTAVFDSTQMGGDGFYEFYSVGVDATGNREAVPTNADQTATFNAGTVWMNIVSSTNIAAGNLSFDNVNLRISNALVTIEGAHTFKNVDLLGTGVIMHAEATLSNEPSFNLTLWTLSVASNASINVNGRGYVAGLLGGNGQEGNTTNNANGSTPKSGGSHGGLGGVNGGTPNPLYGNLTQPTDLGSGGSGDGGGTAGGDGGGRIRLNSINVAADGPIVAHGNIGTGANAGSGSGGSIYLITRTLSGAGLFAANGGGFQVAGGGGRVAVHYTDLSTKNLSLIQAIGGDGVTADGGNGTVFLKGFSEGDGTLVVDGQGVASPYSGLPIPQGVTFDNIIIRNNARVVVDDPIVVHNSLQILTGSILTHTLSQTNGLQINAGTVFVDGSSSIDVSGKGYRGGLRDGNVHHQGETLGGQLGAHPKAGGSYGGLGGINTGPGSNLVYGTPNEPVYLGAGGSSDGGGTAGGNGGGRITIVASNNILVHGAVRADGQIAIGANAGSGAGGSIKITTAIFQGSGTVSAGGGGFQVGGGGGRIKVDYVFIGSGTNDFSGLRNVTAAGGMGVTVDGSAGSVLFRGSSQSIGDLYVDATTTNALADLWSPLTPIGLGRVTTLTTNTLTLDGGVAVLPGGLAGTQLRPNVNSAATFDIISNTATSITVSVASGTNLTDVATAGDLYAAQHTFDNVYLRRGAWLVTSDRLVVNQVLSLAENSVVTHFDCTTNYEPGLHITVGTLTISSNSAINVDGRGYLAGLRGGNSHEGNTTNNSNGSTPKSGGSHGGLGGNNGGTPNPVYDDLQQPGDLGSGGSSDAGGTSGGDGGGRLRLIAGAIINDGLVSANGDITPGANAGSGSGGAIFITAGTVSGTGQVWANGGAFQVGGGGGRVAVHYTTMVTAQTNFQAIGGAGVTVAGGHGTLFFKSAVQANGELVIDGANVSSPNDTATIPSGYSFDIITLRNQAKVVINTPITAIDTFRVLTGSRLSHPRGLTNGVEISASNILVDATSTIDVSAKGYRGGLREGNSHPGETTAGLLGSSNRSAGSHGGLGASTAGAPGAMYDDIKQPADLGGGGSSDGGGGTAGGNGGGRVRLIASNTLTIDGTILANGQNDNGSTSGSGAGGSVYLTASTVGGTGLVHANGGALTLGGGGGRVAVHYSTLAIAQTNFQAIGGDGNTQDGGHGTLFFKSTAQTNGELVIDGANSSSPNDSATIPPGYTFDIITLRNQAKVVIDVPIAAIDTFSILTGSRLSHPRGLTNGVEVSASNIVVDATSTIDVSAKGYRGGLQSTNSHAGETTAGAVAASNRSAGSHGGLGASIAGTQGSMYDDLKQPADLGAGGSSDGGGGTAGGNGGGRVRLIASNSLTIDGTIVANGQGGNGSNSGSGAGGSVYLTAETVAGAGTVNANGGDVNLGGGGGRVAVHYATLAMAQTSFRATGGDGNTQAGGHGTLFFKSTAQANGELVIDGANSPSPNDSATIPPGYTFDLITLRRQAKVVINTPITAIDTFNILTGSRLSHPRGLTNGVEISASNILLDATSTIDVSAKGYRGGLQSTNGHAGETTAGLVGSFNRSAGSHGGLGGSNAGAAGAIYDDLKQPADLGSGGSSDGGGGTAGGNGGGRVRLIASTSLTIDGTIVANGQGGNGSNSGSGAGGSVYLTAETVAGTGTVNANGGDVNLGGGGGRVAVHYTTLAMAQTSFRAIAGDGNTQDGGHGSVFFKGSTQTNGDLIVDGFGHVAVADSTTIPTNIVFDNITIRNGARLVLNSPLVAVGAIQVLSNSVLTHPLSYEDGLRIEAGSLLIGTNSSIDATGRGYRGGLRDANAIHQGLTTNSAAGSTVKAGGSHGGLGGQIGGIANPTYGTATNPVFLGSGGSSDGGGTAGGNGGGRVTLVIGGTLTVDGAVRVDGQNGNGSNAGSGSGGSIKISAGVLDGGGTLEADGSSFQVGGGGGRIAVYAGTLIFSTNRATATGGGAPPGAPGTVYFGSLPAPPSLPSIPVQFIQMSIQNGVPSVSWQFTGTNIPVIIESSTALNGTNWLQESLPVTNTSWTDPTPPDTGTRFYRVRKP